MYKQLKWTKGFYFKKIKGWFAIFIFSLFLVRNKQGLLGQFNGEWSAA